MNLWGKLRRNPLFQIAGIITVIAGISACGQGGTNLTSSSSYNDLPKPENSLREEYWEYEELGSVPVPVMNEMTKEKIELGKMLFFDKRLSGNNQLSCISCHAPDNSFNDGQRVAIGINGQNGNRNTPSLINVAYYKELNLDGSADSLEEQVLGPITNPKEMGQDLEELVEELKAVPEYVNLFNKTYNDEITVDNIAKSIASFERTLVQNNTPFDRFMAGDNQAMTKEQKWGMEIFADKGNCIACHAGPTFSDNDYDNIAVESEDAGRYLVTTKQADMGAFRTPQLRDVMYSAPYMHNGSMETLEEVMEHYNNGKHIDAFTSVDFIQLNLTDEEMAALVAFMEALSGPRVTVEPPVVPK